MQFGRQICNVGVNWFPGENVHKILHGHGTSAFDGIVVDPSRHEPRPLAIYHYRCFRTCRNYYLTCNATLIEFFAWSVTFWLSIKVEYNITGVYQSNRRFCWKMATGFDWQGKNSSSVGICGVRIGRWSKFQVIRQWRDSGLSWTQHACLHCPCEWAINGMMPSLFISLQFAVCNCSDLIDLMESSQAYGRETLFTKLGVGPISRKLAIVSKAFDGVPFKILAR